MGFFARKGAASPHGRSSQEEQLAELRRRARRRLIGALVIVLIAVIFVPLFLKSDGAEEVEQVVQVFPPIVAPESEPQIEADPWHDDAGFTPVESQTREDEDTAATEEQHSNTESEPELSEQTAVAVPEIEMQTEAEVAQESTAKAKEEKQPEPAESQQDKAESAPKQETKPQRPKEPERTDDGSVALALLEGRMPVESAGESQSAAQRGSFTVQVAAYSSSEGANNRREQLISAGVNNAFVEEAGGTYRLRVGPFESRQAAEAALTRLRSLGYEDSFIRSQ